MKKTVIMLLTFILIGLFVGCQEKEKVSKDEVLKIAVMGTYPPYNFLNEKNKIDGFDADISNALAEKMNMKVEFVTNEWSGMIAGLQKGKFDAVISQMAITKEREKSVDFTDPYIENHVKIIVKDSNNSIKNIKDFKNKKIGVGLGTNDEAFLKEEVLPKASPFEIVTYNDVITTLLDLDKGRIDATINNIYALEPMIKKNNLKIKSVSDPLKTDYAAIAVKKGNIKLKNKFNKALKEIQEEGKYDEIFEKWFHQKPSK